MIIRIIKYFIIKLFTIPAPHKHVDISKDRYLMMKLFPKPPKPAYAFKDRAGEIWRFNFNGRSIIALITKSFDMKTRAEHVVQIIRGNNYHIVNKKYRIKECSNWEKHHLFKRVNLIQRDIHKERIHNEIFIT